MTKEIYVTRPRRKPDATVKGKVLRWDNSDYMEFVPVGTRESNRTILGKLGNSSFYKSSGEKESSYSLHLNVDAKSEDPVAEMLKQFMVLTKDERKQEPTLGTMSEGRMLYDNGSSLQMWHDTSRGEVRILTRLECNPQIERQLLQLEGDMSRTLGRYRQQIISNPNNK